MLLADRKYHSVMLLLATASFALMPFSSARAQGLRCDLEFIFPDEAPSWEDVRSIISKCLVPGKGGTIVKPSQLIQLDLQSTVEQHDKSIPPTHEERRANNRGATGAGRPECQGEPEHARVRGANPDSSVMLSVPGEFNVGASTLPTNTARFLDTFRTGLKLNRDMSITINGHADMLGNDAVNVPLSLQRAERAREYLLAGSTRTKEDVAVFGKGSTELVPDFPRCHGKHRRVEIVVRIK